MSAELEALVLALEAVLQARAGEDANRMEGLYQARLDDVCSETRTCLLALFKRWLIWPIGAGVAPSRSPHSCHRELNKPAALRSRITHHVSRITPHSALKSCASTAPSP